MKRLMKKKVNMFGKSVPVFVIALLAIGVVSAALIPYYGQIIGLVAAEQSILLDGENWDEGIEDDIPEESPGGEEFCFEHDLENKMSVPGVVNLESEITGPCTGVDETTCLSMLCDWDAGESECIETGVTSCQAEKLYEYIEVRAGNPHVYEVNGMVETDIEKIWECEDVKWDYTFISDNPNGDKYTLGLVISLDQVKPDFNVWIDDADLMWHYQEYDRDTDSWYGNTVTLPDWISTVGDSTGKTKSISIDPDYLGITDCDQSFYWAVQLRTNVMTWYGDYDWSSDASRFVENVLKESLENPLTLESGEIKDFCNCYDFDKLIAPGEYTITTTIEPSS